MRSRRTWARAAGALLTAGVLTVTAGCSGGSDEPSADEPGAGADESPDTIAPPDLPEPPALRQVEGAVADVEIGDCATDAGEQTVTGEVTNSADEDRDFVIVLNWTNDTSDVRGRGVAVVEGVSAGDTEEWSLDADVADGATMCVPNVRRGALGAGEGGGDNGGGNNEGGGGNNGG